MSIQNCHIAQANTIKPTQIADMLLRLRDIATVSLGAKFSSHSETGESRSISLKAIQMKDLGADNLVRLDECMRMEVSDPKPNQFAKLGDIIFRSRGQSNTAALLNQATTGSTIIAAPLLRVRARADKVRPEFLLWWINQPQAQAYLASRAKGTAIKSVSKQDLERLEILLPSLEQQAQIADLFILPKRADSMPLSAAT